MIKTISESRNVYFIDLEKHVPKSLEYFSDEVHYTDTTYNIISRVIAEEIAKSEIILH
jgi:predicted membrane-bound dolichyl-phosphate-mannose-protein mannosyltransferase